MPVITTRTNLTLISEQNNSGEIERATFRIARNNTEFQVCVDFATKQIECLAEAVAISQETYEALRSDQIGPLQELSSDVGEEIRFISSVSITAARVVVAILKYHLGHLSINENLISIRSKEWKENTKTWTAFPMEISVTIDSYSAAPLNEASVRYVQEQIDSGIEPLIGLRHLHRARNEAIPRHKWIDATTAAELSIKEILIRAHPAMERLLVELPSPPLSKLYGSLLEHYLGQRSPFLNDIKKGVERRNELVHRPSDQDVDGQEAINYVYKVEAAIFHALRLLYPNDKLLQQVALSTDHL